MNDKDAIIAKILDEANAQADALIGAAKHEAAAMAEEAKRQVQIMQRKEREKTELLLDNIAKSRMTVAFLDSKKIMLRAKKDILDRVFAGALAQISALPKADYLKLIEQMLAAAAEDGDSVMIAQKDKSVITAAWLEKTAKKLKRKLVLADAYAEISGGVILSNEKCDKNMSLDLEIENIREEAESEIALMLFGESL